MESELIEATRARRARLWGKPQREARPAQPIPEPEPVITELPKPKPIVVPAELPKPSKEYLESLFDDDEIGWKEGVKTILKSYGENMRRLVSHQRDSHIIECRIAVATYLRNRGWSYPRIGQLMRRDHTSILYLVSPDLKKSRYRKNAAARVVAQRAYSRLEQLAYYPAAVLGPDGVYQFEGTDGDAQAGEGTQESLAGTGE